MFGPLYNCFSRCFSKPPEATTAPPHSGKLRKFRWAINRTCKQNSMANRPLTFDVIKGFNGIYIRAPVYMYISRDILISSSVSNKGYVFLFQEKYTPCRYIPACIYIYVYMCNMFVPVLLLLRYVFLKSNTVYMAQI